MNPNDTFLIEQGLAKMYRGRLIPIMRGGDGSDELFPEVPEDLTQLSTEDLESLESSMAERITEVTTSPEQFLSADRPSAFLISATEGALASLARIRAELSSGNGDGDGDGDGDGGDGDGGDADATLSADDLARLSDLGNLARSEDGDGDGDGGDGDGDGDSGDGNGDGDGDGDGDGPAATAAVVVAAAPPARRRPARARRAVPAQTVQPRLAMTAAGGASDVPLGYEFLDELDIARAMERRYRQFGKAGGNGPQVVEKFTIARSDWSDEYGSDRTLDGDALRNMGLIASATDPKEILENFLARKRGQLNQGLVASGGLCAPVTPYYNLQMISTPDRPVLGALPAFNADRGGIKAAAPASLSAVTDGVGLITAAEDGAGGSSATKNCQVIDCPDFTEFDVDIIYHCLQFGNLGARTFPELVAQWNALTLAAHARLAETNLLTGIDTNSTQVTAGALGLGASATLFSQILAAANGMRNRNRMKTDAVLRLLLPFWAVDLIVSDVIRGQFQRFDTDQQKVVALLRSFNVEPTFYIDGATGRGQVFGEQEDGALLSFPENVVWYLFPEGSFLYLDGGVLELGIVRDSVLNQENNFQIFGESFENVAYVGVESLAVESPVCDSGTVSAPLAVTCPIDYEVAS